MTRVVTGGQSGSVGAGATAKAAVQAQLEAMASMLRQLGGNAEIGAGAVLNDPLNSPYVLYVDGNIGDDNFVGGSYSTTGGAAERIELQRLECGYSPHRPFKTINRAAIEAGIITSKSFYERPAETVDLVSIVVQPGIHTIYNQLGAASVTEWSSGTVPTADQLAAFNPLASGGLILPRGASICSMDLRKTLIRPNFVPTPVDELADASNRRSFFKVTGVGYYFGFTFMDKVGANFSHHLLDSYQFASQAELVEFYAKILAAFGGPNNTGGISPALAVPQLSEYEIVGPRPASGNQTIFTDTTTSASPYIFNCSIRSNYGIGGIFADGSRVSGFKSIVTAQFTGVSQQRDLSCWQKYDATQGTKWSSTYFTSYADFISTDPDNVRMNPKRRSAHIRATNGAIIQEVSVFAIGQGIHHWVQSGGEITVTNSNSNFGGCAALAEGYRANAFLADSDWNVGTLRVASNLSDETNNVRKIFLGTIATGTSNSATALQLQIALEGDPSNANVPLTLSRDGYSLPTDSYLWVENIRGNDYRARLVANAWSATVPTRITVAGVLVNEDGDEPGDPITNSAGLTTGQTWPDIAGARVYVRRLQDSRTQDERKYGIRCNNTGASSRTPIRDYILQTKPGAGGVTGLLPDSGIITVSTAASVAGDGAGAARSALVELRRNNAVNVWSSSTFYRTGDVVRYQSKSYSCIRKNTDSSFDPSKWEEAYVHMEDTYRPEDFWKNTQPQVILDGDTDGSDATTTCGYNLTTVWSTNTAVQAQYRSASDYRGVHALLVGLGFSTANAHTILLPRASSSRERSVASQLDSLGSPAGAATSWGNWPIEFRRPSNIRLFGHAWEWAGYLNYTKALPEYQLELGPVNKFTYYFTNSNGGRVYGSGFNEEGYLVTPQGLQDLATGNEIAFENIGDINLPIDEISFPTFSDQLSCNKLTVNTELNLASSVVKGSPTWQGGYGGVLPALPDATTTQKGIIEIATADEVKEFLRSDLAVTPATLIQALGDAVKSVVNLRVSLSNVSSVPDTNQGATADFLHPYNGNEVALYSSASLRWQVVRFNGIQQFGMASCTLANTNYDIYLYNSGTSLAPTLAMEFAAWPSDLTPPTRGTQDGVLVRNNNPARRLIGVVRTTTAGTSIVDLGGTISGPNSANFPRMYIANLYNLYDARAVYFFGSSWNQVTGGVGWGPPPAAVYAIAPRVSFVQARASLVIAFLDIYNNPTEDIHNAIAYVAPGVNSTTGPAEDAFYGENRTVDTTAGSQWARSMPPGLHNIYYLYQQLVTGGTGSSLINEHPAHGMIVLAKI